jgi:RimJ/RimL family protein N-acetyltransferase
MWSSISSASVPPPADDSPLHLPTLHTKRLMVRALRADDADAVAAVAGGLRPGWLEWSIESYGQLESLEQPPYGERAVELRDSGEVVGMVGVVPSMGPFGQLPGFGGIGPAERFRPEVGLYWGLAPAHRGNGYATEAAAAVIDHGFRELRLARIIATTTRDNHASIAVMRRLGMRVEENPLPEPQWFQVVGWLDSGSDPERV